jgi:hypothetical protein
LTSCWPICSSTVSAASVRTISDRHLSLEFHSAELKDASRTKISRHD